MRVDAEAVQGQVDDLGDGLALDELELLRRCLVRTRFVHLAGVDLADPAAVRSRLDQACLFLDRMRAWSELAAKNKSLVDACWRQVPPRPHPWLIAPVR